MELANTAGRPRHQRATRRLHGACLPAVMLLGCLAGESNAATADADGAHGPTDAPRNTTAAPNATCIARYSKCGGAEHFGPTECCDDGDICAQQDVWYSQCLPPSELDSLQIVVRTATAATGTSMPPTAAITSAVETGTVASATAATTVATTTATVATTTTAATATATTTAIPTTAATGIASVEQLDPTVVAGAAGAGAALVVLAVAVAVVVTRRKRSGRGSHVGGFDSDHTPLPVAESNRYAANSPGAGDKGGASTILSTGSSVAEAAPASVYECTLQDARKHVYASIDETVALSVGGRAQVSTANTASTVGTDHEVGGAEYVEPNHTQQQQQQQQLPRAPPRSLASTLRLPSASVAETSTSTAMERTALAASAASMTRLGPDLRSASGASVGMRSPASFVSANNDYADLGRKLSAVDPATIPFPLALGAESETYAAPGRMQPHLPALVYEMPSIQVPTPAGQEGAAVAFQTGGRPASAGIHAGTGTGIFTLRATPNAGASYAMATATAT